MGKRTAPTIEWRYVRDEDDRELAVGERNGHRFRVVPWHDGGGACVQIWIGGRWDVVRTAPCATDRQAIPRRARAWRSFENALRAVERGDCDPPPAKVTMMGFYASGPSELVTKALGAVGAVLPESVADE